MRAVVKRMAAISSVMGYTSIAEGVETREQLAFLKTRSCGEGQGDYFGRPVVAGEFAELYADLLQRPPSAPRQVSAVSAR